jgi:chromosome segregation ATPase
MNSRTAEREELAKRIDAVKVLSDQLGEAKKAAEKAEEASWRANSHLQSLKAEAEKEPADPADLLARIAAGEDVTTLARPDVELQAKIAKAEDDLAFWRSAREKAKAAIEEREKNLSWAKFNLDDAVRKVIASETDVQKLIEEAEQLVQPLLAARAHLRILSGFLPGHSDAYKAIERFLNRPLEMGDEWKRQPSALEIDQWMKELASNPDALLPGVGLDAAA